MSNESNGTEFFAGLVVGGLIGAALALLLAPQSGEETRAQLSEKKLDWQHVANESLADSRIKADVMLADARAKAENIVADAKAKADAMKAQAKEKGSELQQKGKETLEAQSEKLKEVAAKVANRGEDGTEAEAEA